MPVLSHTSRFFMLLMAVITCLSSSSLKVKPIGAKIISYNIRYDNPDDGKNAWQFRRDSLAQEVISYEPDIIGLQEVLYTQYQFLQFKWPQYASYGIGREDGKLKGEMLPVFFDTTKYKLLSAETKWLSETPDTPGKGWDAACERVVSLVWLYHKKLNDSLLVMNTHWDHVGVLARENSAQLILSLMQPALDAGQHVILLGDFNAKPDEKPIREIKVKLNDSCPDAMLDQGTYNGFAYLPMNSPHIDYIFYSKAFSSCTSYFIHQPTIGESLQMSDHYMISTYLQFN